MVSGTPLPQTLHYQHSLRKRSNVRNNFLVYFPMVTWAVITIFPFYYMLLTATKSSEQIFSADPSWFFSVDSWANFVSNYRALEREVPLLQSMANSLYISTLGTLLTIVVCCSCGYGFAMFNFRFKNGLFKFMVMTLMVPPALSIIPYFSMVSAFGWINEPKAVYLPALANAYGVFLMRQYIRSAVPTSILDAARIDGAGEFRIFWRVVLPVITPGIGALAVSTFLSLWNSFMLQLVVLQQKEFYTVPVALNSLAGRGKIDYGAIMSGNTISILPIAVIFVLCSRMIISGLTKGAVKN
jgi:multiple sugar transport system permease protein